MTANRDLERRIADYYASEAPPRAPDRVLGQALTAVDTTRQRRVLIRVPWRIPNMTSHAKLAVAAVGVIAVGAIGLVVLRPGSSPGVGAPSSNPSPTISPSPDPSTPPALTGTFTSDIHGITISYPSGWVTVPATEPWTTQEIGFESPGVDTVGDPALPAHLFLMLMSRHLDGQAGAAWADEFINSSDGCDVATEPVTVEGADGGVLCGNAGAAVWVGDRGYAIGLYLSGDDPWLQRYYDQAWFEEVLATVRLHPENAVDALASPAP